MVRKELLFSVIAFAYIIIPSYYRDFYAQLQLCASILSICALSIPLQTDAFVLRRCVKPPYSAGVAALHSNRQQKAFIYIGDTTKSRLPLLRLMTLLRRGSGCKDFDCTNSALLR